MKGAIYTPGVKCRGPGLSLENQDEKVKSFLQDSPLFSPLAL